MKKLIAKVEQWADERNLIAGSDSKSQSLKLMSEVGELADTVNKGGNPIDDIGDCLVVLTILAAQEGLTLKQCLEFAYNEIKDRQGVMHNGCWIKDTDPRYESIMQELAE